MLKVPWQTCFAVFLYNKIHQKVFKIMQISNGEKIGIFKNCMCIMHWQSYWYILEQAYGRTNAFGNILSRHEYWLIPNISKKSIINKLTNLADNQSIDQYLNGQKQKVINQWKENTSRKTRNYKLNFCEILAVTRIFSSNLRQPDQVGWLPPINHDSSDQQRCGWIQI